MPFKLGPWELGLILIIILIVFGVGKLPQIGTSLGKTIREFKKATKDEDTEGSEPKKIAAIRPAPTAAEKPSDE